MQKCQNEFPFGMDHFPPKRTGLKVSIWIDGLKNGHFNRYMVYIGTNRKWICINALTGEMIEKGYCLNNPNAINGAVDAIRYVLKNKDLFEKHWNDPVSFDTEDLKGALAERGCYRWRMDTERD